MLTVTFYGVRGSTPCSCDDTRAHGGNTSCVLVEVAGEASPIILDLGTGARYLGADLVDRHPEGSLRATALVTHLHWDHIQGIPFFKPLLVPGNEVEIVGPPQGANSIRDELTSFLRPPAFPVSLDQLPGQVLFRDAANESFLVGSARVTVFDVPHVGATNGYRIDAGGGSIAYISDHQQPLDGSHDVPGHIVEACAGVDVLIHDAQYSAAEFAQRAHWGHCTPDFALELAQRAGARRLVLYHHDPSHDDEWVSGTVARIQAAAGPSIEVIGASERLSLRSGTQLLTGRSVG